jgi:hypothetical protein
MNIHQVKIIDLDDISSEEFAPYGQVWYRRVTGILSERKLGRSLACRKLALASHSHGGPG